MDVESKLKLLEGWKTFMVQVTGVYIVTVLASCLFPPTRPGDVVSAASETNCKSMPLPRTETSIGARLTRWSSGRRWSPVKPWNRYQTPCVQKIAKHWFCLNHVIIVDLSHNKNISSSTWETPRNKSPLHPFTTLFWLVTDLVTAVAVAVGC